MILAALRDNSFYSTPGYGVKYHIVGECEFSKCSPAVPLFVKHMDSYSGGSSRVAEQIPLDRRCGKKGCKEAWPKFKTPTK